MTRSFLCMLILALAGSSASAQVSSYANASNGGTAVSSSQAFGNAQATSAATSHGGYAEAHQVSDARNGGWAGGSTTANTLFGRSVAHGRSTANGPGSVAQNMTLASSYYGQAYANGASMAGPFGQARSETVALSDFGRSEANGSAYAVFGTADSYTLSHSFGPLTLSQSVSHSQGMFGGPTHSAATSVGIGSMVPTRAAADAYSYAAPGSSAQSSATHFNDYGF